MNYQTAVLLTCHNRRDKTLKCLEALYNSNKELNNLDLKIFLVDDGSTDGTSSLVSKHYPEVILIQGDGSLFWNQGMRLAWEKAIEFANFDYFLWLNDDTIIDKNALQILLATDNTIRDRSELRLITAACRANNESNIFSYGGRTDLGPVIPNGEIQECRYVNGNLVLVPNSLFLKIGNLSNHYTHGIGDNDYGLRCIEAGGKCYTTAEFIATCPPNEGIPGWCNPSVPLRKRWKLFHSPRGLNIKEYNFFRKRFWGRKWLLFAVKAYLKVLFPKFYTIIK